MLDKLQDTMRDVASLLGNASDIRVAVQKAINENSELKHQVEGFFEERIKNVTKSVLELPGNTRNKIVYRRRSYDSRCGEKRGVLSP